MRAYSGLEDGERSGCELVLLDLKNLVLGELVARLRKKLPMFC